MKESYTFEQYNLPEAITTQVNKIAELLEEAQAGFRFSITETAHAAIIEIEEGDLHPYLNAINQLALQDTLTVVDVENRADQMSTITVTSRFLN